ncbi:MAG TPA: hypothetical protein VEB18_03515 [Candidatus Paceibacterota bacterium]|nr:hypothetical protein [Candidatus Paceibacterota bacterium]
MFSTSRTGRRPVSAIFVDTPNIVTPKWPAAIDWKRLAQGFLDDKVLVGTDVIHAAAYAKSSSDATGAANWIDRTFKTFGHHLSYVTDSDVTVMARFDKDIDALIINDIWKSTLAHERSVLADKGTPYPLHVRHVLVSGDGDYHATYQDLLEVYKGQLELEVIVYAWKDSLHSKLAEFATEVHYLEDLGPGLMRPRKPQEILIAAS